jgi:hypothetical protein
VCFPCFKGGHHQLKSIAINVVDDLQKEDYCFVVESDEGAWNEIKSEFIIRKVKL